MTANDVTLVTVTCQEILLVTMARIDS
jgi:hypothetical protein